MNKANTETVAKQEALKYAAKFGDDWDRENGYQDGFNAGVQWQRGQGDSLVRDLLAALTDAAQLLDGLDVQVLGGKTNRVYGWQRLIDTAEERA